MAASSAGCGGSPTGAPPTAAEELKSAAERLGRPGGGPTRTADEETMRRANKAESMPLLLAAFEHADNPVRMLDLATLAAEIDPVRCRSEANRLMLSERDVNEWRGLCLMSSLPKRFRDVDSVVRLLRAKRVVVLSEGVQVVAYGMFGDYAERSDVKRLLVSKLREEPDRLRPSSLAAAGSLARARDRRALPMLRLALKSSEVDDRLTAVIDVGNYGKTVARIELKALRDDPNPTVRRLVRDLTEREPSERRQ